MRRPRSCQPQAGTAVGMAAGQTPGRIAGLLACLVCALCAGCGTSEYNQKIEQALAAIRARPQEAPPSDEEGEPPFDVDDPSRGGAGQTIGGRQSTLGMVVNAAERTGAINKLKNLALAMIAYEGTHGRLPPQAIVAADGTPLLSWRVEILKELDPNLYRRFHVDEAWDSPHNATLIETMPEPYDAGYRLDPGSTAVLAVTGPETVFPPGDGRVRLGDIRDGTSNTVLIVVGAAESAVPWTKPDDIPFDILDPTPGLLSGDGTFIAAFCDGSVRRISNSDPTIVSGILTREGAEVIPLGDL